MDTIKTLTFYLEEPMRSKAEDGAINIVNRIVRAFESCGFKCLFHGNSDLEVFSSAQNPGYSMFHMEDPFHARALTLRKAYYYPFWRIESSAKRWEWRVALQPFDASQVDEVPAQNFTRYWRRRLFDVAEQTAGEQGFIYAALQGRLLEHRSFQSMNPIDMLRATALANPDQTVIVTLHPNETYSDAELAAVTAVQSKYSNVQISTEKSDVLLARCGYVVTQNSSVALAGYFHARPAVLFGRIDFHHIAANVYDLGPDQAFGKMRSMRPEFDKYLYWFLQQQSINAGRDDAEAKILATVRAHGWDV